MLQRPIEFTLTPVVGMMDDTRIGAAVPQCHLEGGDYELGLESAQRAPTMAQPTIRRLHNAQRAPGTSAR